MALDWVQQALQKSLGFHLFRRHSICDLEGAEDAQVWEAVQNESEGVPLPPVNGGFCSAGSIGTTSIGWRAQATG